jgi:AmmeMemoRadiSam system protein B
MVSPQATYRVRAPAVGGTFYPRQPERLKRTVADLLDRASAEPRAAVRGIIAPHAGYVYSGPVAAEAFASLRSAASRFRRAVLVGPAHFVRFSGLAAPSQEAFATPLGEIPVDREAIRELDDEGLAVVDDAPHAPDHALEVELPFLQQIFGAMPIVPLLFGVVSPAVVAAAIERLWTPETLLVVSSDLSHFEPYASACRHDRRTAAAVEALDDEAIGPYDACGHLAVRGALRAAARHGLALERLDLRNSGDTAGDRASVVGYGAWLLRQPG